MRHKCLFIFLFIVSCFDAFSQVTYSELSAVSGCSGSSSIASGAGVSFAAGDLAIVYIQNRDGTASPPEPTSISGGGVSTWVKIATVLANSNTQRVTIYRGISTGNTGAITATWGVNQNQKYIHVAKVTGMPTSNNGGDAVVQSATASGSNSTPTVTLSSLTSSSSAVLFYVGGGGTTSLTGTPETGFTEFRDEYVTTCFAQHRFVYVMAANASSDITPSTTLTASTNWGAIGIEIKQQNNRRIFLIN